MFSVTKFAHHGFHAVIKKNATTLMFNHYGVEHPVMLQSVGTSKVLATSLRVFSDSETMNEKYHLVPSIRSRDHSAWAKKRISLEVLHNRLGHCKCRTLLAASEHNLWADTNILMTPEVGCLSCGIATIRATARNKEPHSTAKRPGEYYLFLDILYPIVAQGLHM